MIHATNMQAMADLIITYAPIHGHYIKYKDDSVEVGHWIEPESMDNYWANFKKFEEIYQKCLSERNPIFQLVLCKYVTNFIQTHSNKEKPSRDFSGRNLISVFTTLSENDIYIAEEYISKMEHSIAQFELSKPLMEKIFLEQSIHLSPENTNNYAQKI